MKLYEKGQDYAEVQKRGNYRHSDGQIETAGDWDTAGELTDKLETLLYTQPRTILVLGCRTGYETSTLAGTFDAVVIGVDVVSEFVHKACERTPAMVADMHDLPFPDEFFDLVVCVGTLEHCYAPQQAMEEMCRVCRRYAYVTADLEQDRGPYPSHYAFEPDPAVWKQLFEDAGFEVRREWAVDGSAGNKGLHCFLVKRHY